MSKGLYIGGTDDLAHKIKKAYIGGTDGVAHKIKKAYIGDADGLARLLFSGAKKYIFVGGGTGQFTVSNEDDYNAVTELLEEKNSTIYSVSLVNKVNGELVISRGNYGYYKFNPSTNTLTALTASSTTAFSLSGYEVMDMTYGNGYYFALFYSDTAETYRVAHGSSLTSWTPFTSSSKSYSCFQYHDGAFYACAHSDYKIRRYTGSPPDTYEMSAVVRNTGETFLGFAIFKGLIIASVGSSSSTSGYIRYCDITSDLSVINNQYTPVAPTCLVNTPDRIIGVDHETNKLCYSTDGITWTSVNSLSGLRAVYYENGVYYATQGSTVYMSEDFSTWTQISTGHATPSFISLSKLFICTEMEE